MSRRLVWFSCGAPSAVAAKLTLAEHSQAHVLYCDTGGEHEDNRRFLKDVEAWLGREVIVLKNPKFKDHFEVIAYHRYIVGPTGAKCTWELKRRLREAYQEPGDVHVWGFTAEEEGRARDFEDTFPDLACAWPLIEANLTREDCLALISRAGIELPAMYRLGYKNNNCVGCVKGQMGYWNKVRVDFPEHFARMAALERQIGATVLRHKGKPLPLDLLPPDAGRYEAEPDIQCGLLCDLVDRRFKGET